LIASLVRGINSVVSSSTSCLSQFFHSWLIYSCTALTTSSSVNSPLYHPDQFLLRNSVFAFFSFRYFLVFRYRGILACDAVPLLPSL